MTEVEAQGPGPSKRQIARRVLTRILLTIVALFVAYGGIKFWAETLDSCEKEGNSYAYCLLTMRYQAAKDIFKH
jgi:hypothetical protein